MKRHLIHGLVAGVLSALAGIIYLVIYEYFTMVDFNTLINEGAIAGSSIFGTMLMAVGYGLLDKTNKNKFIGVLNVLIMLLSFLSILGPISMTLPLEFEFPELLPGLAIPMHFFPAMIFFGLEPFFRKRV